MFLLLTATAALAGISLMGLPFGFMADMTLCDTVNGVAMMKMYRSAVGDPRRRIGFNMVITGVSAPPPYLSRSSPRQVLHAMLVLTDPMNTFLAELSLGHAGLILVALLLFIWGVFSCCAGHVRSQLSPTAQSPEFRVGNTLLRAEGFVDYL